MLTVIRELAVSVGVMPSHAKLIPLLRSSSPVSIVTINIRLLRSRENAQTRPLPLRGSGKLKLELKPNESEFKLQPATGVEGDGDRTKRTLQMPNSTRQGAQPGAPQAGA